MIDAYSHLAYQVVVQAIEDFRDLRRLKVIVKGKCREYWPRYKNGTRVIYANGYGTNYSVDELIYWLYGGQMTEWLKMLGSKVQPQEVWDKIEGEL